MRKFWLFGAGAMLAVMAVGCGPKLATSELTPKEQQWGEFIQNYYPQWEVPETYPTAVRTDNSYTPQETAVIESRYEAVGTVSPGMTPALAEEESTVTEEIDADLPAVEAPAATTYKVVKGDTLSGIALRFYGKAHLYGRILEANPVLNNNPNRLRVGQELVIPNPARVQ